MKRHLFVILVVGLLCAFPASLFAGDVKILTNHLGYEPAGPKHAVILGKAGDSISSCVLKDYATDLQVLLCP